MTERMPAEVFPPGEFIRDELEERGWTQADLAYILGRPPTTVNEILMGRKAITPETAQELAAAFGTDADFWFNLESAYRLSLARRENPGITHRAKLYAVAPVKEMIKRRWIEGAESSAELEEQLKVFFEASSLDAIAEPCTAARKSSDYRGWTPSQRAWIYRARKLAGAVNVSKFSLDSFNRGLSELRKLAASEHDVRNISHTLAGCGVRLVVVENLPRGRIDGAAFWLAESKPAVALSLRFDRIDYLWHTFIHELMHIKHGDDCRLDEKLVGEDAQSMVDKPEYEQRADQEAADFLVPRDEMDGFVCRVKPLFSKKRIVQFASRVGIHPGIVVGQLQRRGNLTYAQHRELLAKVRDVLSQATVTDGWGSSLPPLP